MTNRDRAFSVFLATVSVALFITGCAGNSNWIRNAGVKASDPHVVGNRDLNYDYLIVPGDRIGPVRLGGAVSEAVQHLGEPDTVNRSTFRGPGYYADEVYYYYEKECIQFTWQDSGVEPKIENGLRGINVTCNKWHTSDGLHVGMPIKDVISHLGEYCASNREEGGLIVSTKEGVWFEAADRNSLVTIIRVMPVMTNWGGMCKD